MVKIIDVDYILDESGFVEMKYFLSISNNIIIIEFVLILFLIKDDEKIEILKYDYSQKENFHVHKNYLKSNKKEYFANEINISEILLIKREIELNWREYIRLYNQKEYI